MNALATVETVLAMSSREIAELTGKEHKHVLRDARKMLEDLGLSEEGYAQSWTDPQNSQTYAGLALPKELTITLVAGYSTVMRHRIVRRWQELEAAAAQPADPMVVLNDPAAMRGLLLGYTEKVLALEHRVETLEPKADALDRIADSDGLMNPTCAAKALQVQPKRVFDWMRTHGWVYRRAGARSDVAYQDKIAAGLLTHKVHVALREDGSEKVCEQVMVTPKGLTKLAQEMGAH
jgi:phage antirepressor YoqD-like protein